MNLVHLYPVMESDTLSHWSCTGGLKQTPLHWSNPIWLGPWSNGDPPLILQPRPAIRWCIDYFILATGGPASAKPLISSFFTCSTMRQQANDPLIDQVYQRRHAGSSQLPWIHLSTSSLSGAFPPPWGCGVITNQLWEEWKGREGRERGARGRERHHPKQTMSFPVYIYPFANKEMLQVGYLRTRIQTFFFSISDK